MKKVIVLTMVIMLLSACAGKSNTVSKNNYFDKTRDATETILTCLSENNADGIKKLLSQKTKNLPDIDTKIQAILDYFDGKVVSYNEEKKSVGKTSGSKDDGVWTEISAYGHIPEIVIEGADGTTCSIKLPED